MSNYVYDDTKDALGVLDYVEGDTDLTRSDSKLNTKNDIYLYFCH